MTFFLNHLPATATCGSFTLPTASFRVLYCLIMVSHDRRRIVHFNVMANPSAEWRARGRLAWNLSWPEG
jgi:putative transposase